MRLVSYKNKIIGSLDESLDYFVESGDGRLVLDKYWVPSSKFQKNVDSVIIDDNHFNEIKSNIDNSYIIKDGNLEKTFEKKLAELRDIRNQLLNESDELSMAIYADVWNSMADEYKNNWIKYRKDLRDATKEYDGKEDPEDFEFPSKPLSYNEYIDQ